MVEVLEPNWHSLEEKLKRVTTVDEVLKFHDTFLDKCLKECLLTNQQLVKVLTKLLITCKLFSELNEGFTDSVKVRSGVSQGVYGRGGNTTGKRQARIDVESEHIRKIAAERNYMQLIERFEKNFDERLGELISHLQDKASSHYDHHLANLATRLDYNGFYTNYFEETY